MLSQFPSTQHLAPSSLISAARKCLGTPFHHQGRTPGAGLDCIGLIVVALRAAGMNVQDRTDYARRPDGKSLVEALEAHGFVPAHEIRAGNILLFRYDRQPQHAALATGPDSMIHAFAPAGAVVETSIGAYWRRRLVGVYGVGAGDRVSAGDKVASALGRDVIFCRR